MCSEKNTTDLPSVDYIRATLEYLTVLLCDLPQASRHDILQLGLLVPLWQPRKVRAADIRLDSLVTIWDLLV